MIYAHLGHSEYLVDWFENDDIIELARMDAVNMEDYISTHDPPSRSNIEKLIWQLVCAHCYVHDKKVMIYDLFLRNISVKSDLSAGSDISLRLCDFGNAILVDEVLDISNFVVEGVSAQTDIFNLGWAIYSLVKWDVHSYDLFHPTEQPDMKYHIEENSTEESKRASEDDAEEPYWPLVLPETDGLLCGNVIRKCWTKQAYHTVHVVRDAVMKEVHVAV